MPATINKSDIDRYREDIKQHGVEGAIRVYSELLNKGYNYAGWAKGVAKGDTITGEAAILFLQDSSGRHFSESELNSIRVDMAGGYLDALEANMKETGGKTNTDIIFAQAREFHKSVFEKHRLRIENWTLEEPMNLIGKYGYGKQSQDQAWQELMKTKGDDAAAVAASARLYLIVVDFADGRVSVDHNGRYQFGPNSLTNVYSGNPLVELVRGYDAAAKTNYYDQLTATRAVEDKDQSDALIWLRHATQPKAVLHAEAQRILGEDTALAQASPAQQLSLESLPENAQRIYHSGRAHLEAFYQKNNQSYSEESLNNAAMALTAAGYEQKMKDVSMLNIKDGEIFIGHKAPHLQVASVNMEQAVVALPEESMRRIQQTEQRFAQDELNRQMMQSQSRGMMMS